MKLTILETGRPPEGIRDTWPDYAEMTGQLLAPYIPGLKVDAVATVDGQAFPDPEHVEAVLVTGSAFGVYDETPWMQPLFEFIRDVGAIRKPLIGICFGHQAVAKAYGATVEKSDKGWGIGRHVYDIFERRAWMGNETPSQFSLAVSHQDQVQSLAPGAVAVAGSDFAPYAALDYPAHNAMSFQGHPEYSPAFANALYGVRKGTILPVDMVEAAEQSLTAPIDNQLIGRWMANHLTA